MRVYVKGYGIGTRLDERDNSYDNNLPLNVRPFYPAPMFTVKFDDPVLDEQYRDIYFNSELFAKVK